MPSTPARCPAVTATTPTSNETTAQRRCGMVRWASPARPRATTTHDISTTDGTDSNWYPARQPDDGR